MASCSDGAGFQIEVFAGEVFQERTERQESLFQEYVDWYLSVAAPPPISAIFDKREAQFLGRNLVRQIHGDKLGIGVLNDADGADVSPGG